MVQLKIRGSSVVNRPVQHRLSSCAKIGIIFNFSAWTEPSFLAPPRMYTDEKLKMNSLVCFPEGTLFTSVKGAPIETKSSDAVKEELSSLE